MGRYRWLGLLAAAALLTGAIAWFIPLSRGESASPLIHLKRLTLDPLSPPAELPQPEDVDLYLIHQPEFFNDAARGVMDVQPIWDLGLQGAGHVVAVADTALDTGDPQNINADFVGRTDAIIDYSGDWPLDDCSGRYGTGPYLEIPVRPNDVEGWGQVDLHNSLVPDAPPIWWFEDHSAGLVTGDQVTYSSGPNTPLHVTDPSEPLGVTLAWTDYHGAVGANPALVNDLDLEVIAPDGTHYYGNDVQWDRVNSVEGINVTSPQVGEYTIVVHAHNVPQQTQPYTLIVSGALGEGPSPTDTPTATDTPSATPTDTPTPTYTSGSHTDTPIPPTRLPAPTASPVPDPRDVCLTLIFKNAAEPSPTPTLPTSTPLPTSTSTPTPLPSPTDTPTLTPTSTPTAAPPDTPTYTPPPVCGEVIENGDFEQGHVAWTEQSSGGYDIITDQWNNPYQGSWVAWFGGYNDAVDRLTQMFHVPSSAQDHQILTFYLFVESDDSMVTPYDYLYLRFLNVGGAPISDPVLIADNTTPMPWTQQIIDLDGFGSVAGQDIQIEFEATTDYSMVTNFVIDVVSLDIQCTGGTPPPGDQPHVKLYPQ